VLHAAGTLAYIQGDYSAAWALLEEGLATRRQLGDRKGIAHTLNNLGILTRQQGDFASARALHDESLAIRRELGDRLGVAHSLNNLGLVARRSSSHWRRQSGTHSANSAAAAPPIAIHGFGSTRLSARRHQQNADARCKNPTVAHGVRLMPGAGLDAGAPYVAVLPLQIRSMIPAMPWPPPMHIVISA
jgi:tetratricopeptide (TPR) repeat protein